ncbi:MAG: ABC transporter permease, partial [Hyphomicrobiaceae bacterium]|nr:ABC transporter permease [Hyphomicrobiaceae bacterium]
MLNHYLKIAFRALLADRFFSLVNILGLSAGIASVSIIFLFVAHQLSYDTWLPNYATLYRIDTVEATPGHPPAEIARAPGPLRDALVKDFPQIASVARAYLAPASVLRDGQPFTENVLAADPNLFRVLGLPFVKGASQEAIEGTTSVALSERKARELFGDKDPIGQRLSILVPEAKDFVVSAVFATIPENSHLAIDIVIPLEGYFRDADDETRSIPEQWGGAYFYTYARLKPDATVMSVEKGIPAFVDRNLPPTIAALLSTAPHDFYNFKFVPVTAVHFDGAPIMAMKPRGDRGTVIALSAVGLLILLIASINFANLTSARSLLRFREVALRKVVGADRRDIIAQFLVEAVQITALAALVSVVVMVVALPYIGDVLGTVSPLGLTGSWGIWALLIVVVLVVAIGAGLYPALVVAGIRPGLILNRDYLRGGSNRIRNALVVVQFAVSIALMTITFGMVAQTRYAQQIDLGFNRSNLLIVRVPPGPRQATLAAGFKRAVSRIPDVSSVALSSAVPSDPSEDNITVSHPSSAKPIQLGFHKVDSAFFRTLGTAPTAGSTSSMRRAEATAPLPPGQE